jgi:hypothetical protein
MAGRLSLVVSGTLALGLSVLMGSWALGLLSLGLLDSLALGLMGSWALGLMGSWVLGLMGSWAETEASEQFSPITLRSNIPRSALCVTLDSNDLETNYHLWKASGRPYFIVAFSD